MVSAINESTTGGARGTTHGSCLPPTWSLIDFFFFMSTLFCILEMDDAGLNAILNVIGIPFEIPPKMPPELLVFVKIFPPFIRYASLFSEPNLSEPAKPEPNSIPLTAGIEKIALLMSDSNEPKIGSP